MHTYVYRGAVYNSEDLEETRMDDRLDKENVADPHRGILSSHEKGRLHVLCRDVDEPGKHHSQQIDTRTENETPDVLSHRWVLNMGSLTY